MVDDEAAWAIETSKDGGHWRYFGKGWAKPGEPLLVHGAPRFIRYRQVGADADWSPPLERKGDQPMTLLDLDTGTRRDLWPGPEHAGLPVLLPGGEEGRLLRFEHTPEGDSWTWALEFRGRRSS